MNDHVDVNTLVGMLTIRDDSKDNDDDVGSTLGDGDIVLNDEIIDRVLS